MSSLWRKTLERAATAASEDPRVAAVCWRSVRLEFAGRLQPGRVEPLLRPIAVSLSHAQLERLAGLFSNVIRPRFSDPLSHQTTDRIIALLEELITDKIRAGMAPLLEAAPEEEIRAEIDGAKADACRLRAEGNERGAEIADRWATIAEDHLAEAEV